MTVCALCPESAPVRVVVSMAVEALPRRIAELLSVFMTGFAGKDRVCAVERKIRYPVIKDVSVEPNDVGIAPQVIRVAELALRFGGADIPAVKSTLS